MTKKKTTEQKAKAYDEAKYIMKKYIESGNAGVIAENTIKKAFPELKESDDEKIRKELIRAFTVTADKRDYEIYGNGITYKQVLAWLEKQSTPQVRTGIEWVNTIDDACDKRYSEEYAHGEYCHEQSFKWGFQEGVDWLEKQGEQKPVISDDALREGIAHFGITQYQIDNWLKKYVDVEKQGEQKPIEVRTIGYWNVQDIERKFSWSEEDEKMLNDILIYGEHHCYLDAGNIAWLKSLKERVQLQPKQEWSEEEIESCAREAEDNNCIILAKHIRQLKSLRPQSQWKPSENELEVLRLAAEKDGTCLMGLYEQLKKLREE